MSKDDKERPKTLRAFSVDQFCADHGICRASLYNLWRAGRGPRRMKIGHRTMISIEAAEDYRRAGGDAA